MNTAPRLIILVFQVNTFTPCLHPHLFLYYKDISISRSYTVRIAALAIDADHKWIDNVLSHYSVAGVEQGTRGVERRLNDDALLALALCRVLSKTLGVPVASAVAIANESVRSRANATSRYDVSPGVTLQFSLDDIEGRLRDRLNDATESVAHVRRGRPSLRPREHD